MKRTLLALGVAGLVGIALVGAGCGGKAVLVGSDGGGDSGGPDGDGGVGCTTVSKCPADPLPTASQIQACEMAQNDAKCGAVFTALLDCAYATQMCDASGHTQPITGCDTQVAAYTSCLKPPPIDAGPPPPSCATASKCPADPQPTQSQIQQCQMDMNDPRCGPDFTALFDCAFANQMCDASGHTIQTTACNAQVMAYSSCLVGPPVDAGGGGG